MAEDLDARATRSDLATASGVLRGEIESLGTTLQRGCGRAAEKGTRRHFDVVAERIESHVALVAEVNSHHATVLDNREPRFQKIERRRP